MYVSESVKEIQTNGVELYVVDNCLEEDTEFNWWTHKILNQ